MDDFKIIFESLQKQYPHYLVGVAEVATIFNCSKKTVYMRTCRKAKKPFPVMPAKGVAGKKFKLIDCAKALAEM